MIAADFHMHTNFSSDSKADPEDMVKGAIEKGLKTICFTDHHDKDIFSDGSEEVLDLDRYVAVMKNLRQEHQDKIDVRVGIEIGLQRHLGDYYRQMCDKYPLDFVIGSVHAVHGEDLYYNREVFTEHGDIEGYRIILLEMLEDIRAVSDFDVLGHLDYMVRYGIHQDRDYSYQHFSEEIDAVLTYLIQHGKGIEINMSGFKYGLGFCHPHPDVIKRYRELSGEIITVGADAHRPDHIAYDYDRVTDLLKSCGFAYYTEFKDRKPIFKSL